MMGPGMAYGLGGLMLRLYVDIDRMPAGEPRHTQLSPGARRPSSLSIVGDTEPGGTQVQIPAVPLTLDLPLNFSEPQPSHL